MRHVVYLVTLALLLPACGGPEMPHSRSGEERKAEADLLRQGAPRNGLSGDLKQAVADSETAKADEKAADQKAADQKAADQKAADQKAADQKAADKKAGNKSGEPTPEQLALLKVDPETGMMSPPPQVLENPELLVLGEFTMVDKKPILDGDTIKVKDLDASLRLLGLDSEETFKKKKNREASDWDFDAYAKKMRGDAKRPAKYGTPLGEEATQWAIDWFDGDNVVRLEYDEVGRQKGVFGRYLVYVFAKKNGKWVNYNVEAVRAGMAPYFPKYGYSRRFHDEFVQAQKEAQAAKVGIWGEGDHYPDYDERLAWWTLRGNQLVTFEVLHKGKDDVFQLGLDEEWERMEGKVGEVVTVFGTLGDKKLDKSPFIASMSHKRFNDFGIVAFDMADLDALDLDKFSGEYVYVRGKLSKYKDKYQFKATDVESIWTE